MDSKFFKPSSTIRQIDYPTTNSIVDLEIVGESLENILNKEKKVFRNMKLLFEEQKKFYEELVEHITTSKNTRSIVEKKITEARDSLHTSEKLILQREKVTKENFSLLNYLSGNILYRQKIFHQMTNVINGYLDGFLHSSKTDLLIIESLEQSAIHELFTEAFGFLSSEILEKNAKPDSESLVKKTTPTEKQYTLSDCKKLLQNYSMVTDLKYQACIQKIETIERYRKTCSKCSAQILATDKTISDLLLKNQDAYNLVSKNLDQVNSVYHDIHQRNSAIEKQQYSYYSGFKMNTDKKYLDENKFIIDTCAIDHFFERYFQSRSQVLQNVDDMIMNVLHIFLHRFTHEKVKTHIEYAACSNTIKQIVRERIQTTGFYHGYGLTLSSENRKGLSKESSLREFLFSFIPEGMVLGKAYDTGDCFFDSLAQSLNQINQTHLNNVKNLRHLCLDFYSKNKEVVDQWSTDDFGNAGKKDDYSKIQFTIEESETDFNGITPIWGRPNVEGRVLCQQLNLEGICIIEILEDPEQKKPVASFHLATKKVYKNIGAEEAKNWIRGAQIPILIVEQNSLHFVPLMRGNIPVSNVSPCNKSSQGCKQHLEITKKFEALVNFLDQTVSLLNYLVRPTNKVEFLSVRCEFLRRLNIIKKSVSNIASYVGAMLLEGDRNISREISILNEKLKLLPTAFSIVQERNETTSYKVKLGRLGKSRFSNDLDTSRENDIEYTSMTDDHVFLQKMLDMISNVRESFDQKESFCRSAKDEREACLANILNKIDILQDFIQITYESFEEHANQLTASDNLSQFSTNFNFNPR